MEFTYKGKPVIPTKTAMNELSELNLDLYKAIEILEKGFQLRKRKKNIIEKAIIKRNKIINIVIIDMNNYYKLIHAGKFSLTKKFKKIIRQKNHIK